MKPPTDAETAIYHAALDLMDGMGNYPMTRNDIIDAIGNGSRDAWLRLLGAGDYPWMKEDTLKAIREGVTEAHLEHLADQAREAATPSISGTIIQVGPWVPSEDDDVEDLVEITVRVLGVEAMALGFGEGGQTVVIALAPGQGA